MFILDLNLGISVGLLKFGIDRQVVWKIMKEKYKCERESLTDGREYYGALDLLLKYKNDKLYMAQFIAEPKNKVCEIKLNGEKIWPRTRKKFFSIFEQYYFDEFLGSYTSPDLDIGVQWEDNPPSFVAAIKGFGKSQVEVSCWLKAKLSLKKGMTRKEVRKLMKVEPKISDDNHTDIFYNFNVSKSFIFLTYDIDDILVSGFEQYSDDEKINIV